MWRRTIHGLAIIPNTSFREILMISRNDPASFVETGGKGFACGRDPYFPAWPDVLQLNAFKPGLRQAVIETLSDWPASAMSSLRYGNAPPEQHFRAHMGSKGRDKT